MPSDVPIIQFDHVGFNYGDTVVLRDVNICLHQGSTVCVVGPNGGGKSTFLKLILGLLRPSSGEVRLFGESPQTMRRRIGYMPQHLQYDPKFPVTVEDIVLMGRLGRRLFGRYTRADRDAAMRSLDTVGIADLAERQFSALSGGQRQRTLIARALVCEPELLLLDEPTANVDMAVEAKFYETLGVLAKTMSIVLVSHDLGFVTRIVDSVVCVNRNVHIHPITALTGELIQELYGADLSLIRHDHHCEDHSHVQEHLGAGHDHIHDHDHSHSHGHKEAHGHGHDHGHSHSHGKSDGGGHTHA